MRTSRNELMPRPVGVLRRASAFPDYAVFTAVEGTLLDFETFDSEAARPLVNQLHAAGVPIVPVTVLTLEEMEPIADDLALRDPMIIEAGGAIARWQRGAWQLQQFGDPADILLDAICEIEKITGADLLVYSVLPENESSELSGRRGAMLRASLKRRFSEPFLVERGHIAEVRKAAASLGFAVHRGKRFYYLARAESDGLAFQQLRSELRCGTAIGVGGSPIDGDILSRAEIPIIVPRSDGNPDQQLLSMIPNVMIAPMPGAAGWAAAVSHVWTALLTADSTSLPQ